MVEPITHSAGKSRIQRAGGSDQAAPAAPLSPGIARGAALGRAAATTGASDMLSLSSAATAMPSELRAGPPVDIETVSRIREAIAENRYPIDLQAITESLFQSFLEISR